jgi:hypothetical protein
VEESDALVAVRNRTDTEPAPGVQAVGRSRLIEHWQNGEVWNRRRSESEDNLDLVGWVVDVPFQHGTLAMNRGRLDQEAGEFTQEEIDVLAGFADVVSLGYTRFLVFQRLATQNRALEAANAQVAEALADSRGWLDTLTVTQAGRFASATYLDATDGAYKLGIKTAPLTAADFPRGNDAEQVRKLMLTGGAGDHQLRWDGRDGASRLVPPGIYLYRLYVNSDTEKPKERTGTITVAY